MDVINSKLQRPFIKNEHNGIRFQQHHVIQKEDDGLLWEKQRGIVSAHVQYKEAFISSR